MSLSTLSGFQLVCGHLCSSGVAVLLLVAGCNPAHAADRAAAPDTAACVANPYADRTLYLRGDFNTWNADEAYAFRYRCNRFELVTGLKGKAVFKVGDDEWSKDADFGAKSDRVGRALKPAVAGVSAGVAQMALTPKGVGIHYSFNGNNRLVLTMTDSNKPTLSIENCPPPPLGDTTLYLRGAMNNWAALEDFAFQYQCDAYYLNVNLSGPQAFKIADAAWGGANTFGVAGDGSTLAMALAHPLDRESEAPGLGNIAFNFSGEYTLRLVFAEGKPSLTIGAKSFADGGGGAVSDPVALSLRHDSRQLMDKSPFGAVSAGTAVRFALRALPGVERVTLVVEKRRLEGNQEVLDYREFARLPLTKVAAGADERWLGSFTFNEVSVYGYYFEAVIAGKTYVYQNNRDTVYWTREKGSNGIGLVGERPTEAKRIRRFRHTVYAKDFVVPDWAKDAVFYYIFPERFRNGDPANDPKPGVDRYQDKPVEFHANWLEKPFKPGTGDGSDGVYNNDFFGGDLAGIIDKLDTIADLGANTLYLTPIFRAASNHKYDTADYRNVDPHFGSNADFTRLTEEAARRGIRVIPDASLNHTGSDSIYFDRFGKYQSRGAFEGGKIRPDSPYASWYRFDPKQKDPNKQFTGWVGVVDLPELDKSSRSFRQFAYGADDSIMKLWLNRGAAGWRMDVAPWVPDDFWREWRAAIKRHKPDALTIAETWFDASKFFLGDSFDSTMNYLFRNTVLDYANGAKASAVYHNIELMREAYPPQSFYALMNLISSHDQARALHIFGYRDDKTDPAAIQLAKQRLRLATFFQMVFPGAPTVYYGDEVGVTGGDDPYNRATYPWADLGGKPDEGLRADFKRLIKLRQDHPVLRHGSLGAPLLVDAHLIVLARNQDKTWALTATNNATTAKTVTVKLPEGAPGGVYVEALSGTRVVAAAGSITLTVPPLFGGVWVRGE